MKNASHHSTSATLQTVPLALIYSSQRLLTEKSSVIDEGYSLKLKTEIFAIRTTLVTPILREIPGYAHGGINE